MAKRKKSTHIYVGPKYSTSGYIKLAEGPRVRPAEMDAAQRTELLRKYPRLAAWWVIEEPAKTDDDGV